MESLPATANNALNEDALQVATTSKVAQMPATPSPQASSEQAFAAANMP